MSVIKELLSADMLSGLLGAGIGGAFTLWGVTRQNKAASRSSLEMLAKNAAQDAYHTLFELRVHMEEHTRAPDTQRQWNNELRTALSRVKNNTNLLPKSQEVRRKRVAEALAFAQKGWTGDVRWEDYAVTLNLAISYARENLGTFVRDDDLPAERDLKAEARTYLAKAKRQHKINRLHYLEQMIEHGSDLEPEEVEEAEQLQRDLGIKHTDELHQKQARQVTS